MENMSSSDIAAVTRGNDDGDGWGGNGAWWIIVLFLFMFGAGWNRGGGANYNAAQNTASINANTTAAVQKVLDAIQKDKIEALQGQVNQLQLQSALCGVVRYPNSTTFTAGYNPYFNANACGCGCGTTF